MSDWALGERYQAYSGLNRIQAQDMMRKNPIDMRYDICQYIPPKDKRENLDDRRSTGRILGLHNHSDETASDWTCNQPIGRRSGPEDRRNTNE